MAIGYTQCGSEIHDAADQVMQEHHKALRLSDGSFPRLCLMFVHDVDDEQPLKLHGYPCAAVISVIPHKQRADKRADAEILIDEKWWNSAGDKERTALLDHEITHLEICIDDAGFVKCDDQGRPKFKLRLHDWQLGGFRCIAERYGDAAPEVQMARQFEKDFGGVTLASAAPLFA